MPLGCFSEGCEMFFVAPRGWGSAECFKMLFKHLLFLNCCFCIVSVQFCFAIVFCNNPIAVLQLRVAIAIVGLGLCVCKCSFASVFGKCRFAHGVLYLLFCMCFANVTSNCCVAVVVLQIQ